MKPATKKITQLIRQTIDKVDDKAEVILFGSRARGEEKKRFRLGYSGTYGLSGKLSY